MARKKEGAVIDTGAYDYKTIRVRGKDGKIHYSRGNADAIAKAMLLHLAAGKDIEQVIRANKLEIKASGANAGLVRMTVGGALRAKVRAGEEVKIGSLVVKSLKQHIDLPKVEDKAPARKAVKKAKTADKPARRQRRRSVPKPVETPEAEPVQDAA